MKKDFRDYLLQHERTHYYRVKTIVPIGDFGPNETERAKASSALSRIEGALMKFDPVAIMRVKKTILQRAPLDFVNVQNKEVYILDFELGVAASPVELQHLITTILDCHKSHVMVYGEADPREIGDQIAAAVTDIKAEAEERGLSPAALIDDPDNSEADFPEAIKYGDSYNSRLLSYFNSVRKDVETEEENYNDDIDGALNAHPDVESGEEHEIKTVRRTYRDEEGKLYTITRKIDRFGKVDDCD